MGEGYRTVIEREVERFQNRVDSVTAQMEASEGRQKEVQQGQLRYVTKRLDAAKQG